MENQVLTTVLKAVKENDVPQFVHPRSHYLLSEESSYHAAKASVEFLCQQGRKTKADVKAATEVVEVVFEVIEGKGSQNSEISM